MICARIVAIIFTSSAAIVFQDGDKPFRQAATSHNLAASKPTNIQI
jgi:hypothetical protein